jgi:hypothetical protein
MPRSSATAEPLSRIQTEHLDLSRKHVMTGFKIRLNERYSKNSTPEVSKE